MRKLSGNDRVTKRAAEAAGGARGARSAGAGRPVVKTTLSELAYEALRERILDQTLPPGARLNIDALTRELSVSSSPIREALVRLEAERLVISELYSGYSVAPHPTPDYLHNLLDFRILIEGHCARIGAPMKKRATIAALRQYAEKMASTPRLGTKYREYHRFVQADGRFHQVLVDSAENEVMSNAYASLHALILQSRLYLNRSGGSERAEEVVAEHQRILRAFEAGNGDEAEAAVRAHLEGGRRRLLNSMAE
jgi:DNA-binding GntR family transcriptional regulator